MPVGPGYFESRQQPNKKLFVSAGSTEDVTLDKRHIMASAAAATTTVNLPNVSEAEGYKFIVNCIAASTNGIKVDMSDGVSSDLSVDISTTGVQLIAESDGIDWHTNKN